MGTKAPEGGSRHHGTIDPRFQTAESSTCWEGCGLGTLWEGSLVVILVRGQLPGFTIFEFDCIDLKRYWTV